MCVNEFSVCKNLDCDMVAMCIFLRQCVQITGKALKGFGMFSLLVQFLNIMGCVGVCSSEF